MLDKARNQELLFLFVMLFVKPTWIHRIKDISKNISNSFYGQSSSIKTGHFSTTQSGCNNYIITSNIGNFPIIWMAFTFLIGKPGHQWIWP